MLGRRGRGRRRRRRMARRMGPGQQQQDESKQEPQQQGEAEPKKEEPKKEQQQKPQAGGLPFAVPPQVERVLQQRAEAGGKGPDTFLHGAVNGTGMIVGGALAGVAMVVTLPLVGLAKGGIGGLIGGSIGGALAGGLIPVAGALAGTSQIVSGVFNTPATVATFVRESTQPEKEYPDLEDAESEIKLDAEDTAHARDEIVAALDGEEGQAAWPEAVADRGLYETLGVEPAASQAEVRAAFLRSVEGRGVDDEARQAASSAFQALRDPERRRAYNEKGAEGLEGFVALPEADYRALVLGDAAFRPYVGVLAAGTAEGSAEERRDTQKSREEEVAHALRARIEPYCDGRVEEFVRDQVAAAEGLRATAHGRKMLTLIGHAYKAKALLILGHHGVLSWISGGFHDAREAIGDAKGCSDAVVAAAAAADVKARLDRGDFSRDERAAARAQVELQERNVNAAWAVTVLDVESTVRAAVASVLERNKLRKELLQARARAIITLGNIFLRAGEDHYSAADARAAAADDASA